MPAGANTSGPVRSRGELEALLRRSGYGDEWHMKRLVETALLVPPAAAAARLVDLGTHPAVLNVLAQAGGYEQADGVDCVEGGPERWNVTLPKTVDGGGDLTYTIHNRDVQKDRLPFPDECADLVTALEVLEHLLDPMHLLIEANRVLKPGGLLLLTTPNAVSWRSVLRAARRWHPFVYPVLIPGLGTNRHNIEYTPDQVRSLLAAAGFDGHVSTRAWWYRVSWLDKLRLTLAGFRPRDRGDSIVVTSRKVSGPKLRFPPDLYQLTPEMLERNESTTLTYRRA
jgi:SAM-dependent methyltransferase